MDLAGRLARFAFPVPRALLVVAPGATAERLAIERALRRRGGRPAANPAEADTLALCGEASRDLEEIAERVWSQIPAPRARIHLRDPADADAAVDAAVRTLTDWHCQRMAASERDLRARPVPASDAEGGDHGTRHHHDHESMPTGLAMASSGTDRDGLTLDQLHVQLGPILRDWPSGLIVDLVVQGDVIQDARVQTVAVTPACRIPAFWDAAPAHDAGGRTAAAHLDSAGRLLALSGWDDAALTARRLRDDLLDGRDGAEVGCAVGGLERRVRRSRMLRWLLQGIGQLDRDAALAAGIDGPALRAGGDVRARLLQWLGEAQTALADGTPGGETACADGRRRAPAAAVLAALPNLIQGLEIGQARLVIASLDPDLDQLLAGGASVLAAA